MSAPDTNIDRQKRRHVPALTGIAVASAFAATLLVAFLIYIAAAGSAPDGAETQIDGRTGQPVVQD